MTLATSLVRRPDGDAARLSIQDTGAAVEPALAGRIAEPYFMKRHGRGRGLEFAVMYQLMAAYGGSVSVESSTAGTTFHLDFPRAA
jgi:C4-dicarboxylate-specific signal transduction histidine kinase